MEPFRIGIAGLGTVAQGVLSVLGRNAELIESRAGRAIQVVAVASRSAKPVDLLGADFTTDVHELVTRNDVDAVVELIGGEDTALELVRGSLQAGRSVVTANKAILAGYGQELFDAADASGAGLGLEASVAGGIPVIAALSNGLSANAVSGIAGIINGTCNYILTAMSDEGQAFETALATAQELGYAEADPTFDIGGIDAAHKLTILSALAFGTPFEREAVITEGIEAITSQDIRDADELGYRIKHLGIARRTELGIEARVHPTFVPKDVLIANVNDVMNAVEVFGDATGSTLYYGPGAGGEATASAVIADIVSLARGDRTPRVAAGEAPRWVPVEALVSAAFLRIPVKDEPGVFAKIATVLSEHGISIESAVQRERAIADQKVPIVVVTQPVIEREILAALAALEALPEVVGEVRRVRVEHLDG